MTLSFENAQRGMVQIRSSDDSKPAGTGFFVASDYILTCAHVVKAVLAETPTEGDEVDIRVFREDSNRRAVVVSSYFEEGKHGADVTLLRLIDTPPDIPIAPRHQLSGFDEAIALKIFGYSSADGLVIEVVAQGQLDGIWVQLEGTRTTGGQIEDGFSGAPVWCSEKSAWVGMVVAREQFRETDRIGYMIPEEQFTRILSDLRADSLYSLLARDENALVQPIQSAYEACRAERKSGLAKGLKAILRELSCQGTGGTSEKRLVLFAAGLFLSDELTQELSQGLTQWIQKNTTCDFSELCNEVRQLQVQRQSEKILPSNPCLWIQVQADKVTQKEPYQINGRFIPNPQKYDSEVSTTFRPLSNQGWKKYTHAVSDPETSEERAKDDKSQGWRYPDLPAIIATYFDQLGDIDLSQLTIEIFLPSSLMNQGIELIQIPSEEGDCLESITQDHEATIVLRSQRRLELNRSANLWKKQWQKLQDAQSQPSSAEFVTSDNDKPQRLRRKLKTAIGLKLDYAPSTSETGEIASLLATGTPAALWVRCKAEDGQWCSQIDQQVLAGTIAEIPETVAALRRDASFIDEVEKIEESSELGHRLSFLWEDPRHVPPTIYYSDEALL